MTIYDRPVSLVLSREIGSHQTITGCTWDAVACSSGDRTRRAILRANSAVVEVPPKLFSAQSLIVQSAPQISLCYY